MKKVNIALLTIILLVMLSPQTYPYSIRHHLINIGKGLVETVGSPLYGTFIQGPKNIKNAYNYEVWEREKEEKRGLLRYKLFGIWRAPGEQLKGMIDGVVDSVKGCGKALKNILSIFFSD